MSYHDLVESLPHFISKTSAFKTHSLPGGVLLPDASSHCPPPYKSPPTLAAHRHTQILTCFHFSSPHSAARQTPSATNSALHRWLHSVSAPPNAGHGEAPDGLLFLFTLPWQGLSPRISQTPHLLQALAASSALVHGGPRAPPVQCLVSPAHEIFHTKTIPEIQ
jgi:hypothetical protein